MSVQRVHRKRTQTPEQLAETLAVRERYQREKPSLDRALAMSGQSRPAPLGEVFLLRQVVSLLKRERVRQNLTLAGLAEKTGISEATLSRLETGKAANPTIDTIYRITAALGKELSCTLQDSPKMRASPPIGKA
jgi:DNA-binding Xre family transcriptional regulator